MYHPFGRELMLELVNKIEASLLSSLEHLFIVYQNPVWGSVLDASPLRRWFAGSIAFDSKAIVSRLIGHDNENVVIWQSVQGARADADREILVTSEHRGILRLCPMLRT